MGMRIAIVGASGTLGRHVATQLADRGHEVRALSRRSQDYPVDLTTGEGLDRALDGCAAVVDVSNAASPRRAAAVLVEGTRRLLTAERAAGIGHHVCVSIVGCERLAMGYYTTKASQEQLVEHGPVPWSIVRATQFHELAASALAAAARTGIIPVPRMTLQTVAAAEVAAVVADVAGGQPLQRRTEIAGPQINAARDLARIWLDGTGNRALLLPLPLPGRLGRALRDGALTTAHPDRTGTISFADWLTRQDAAPHAAGR